MTKVPARKEPRILFWDIEATNLSAPFGTILCIGYKWLGEKKVYIPTIMDFSKDKRLSDKGLVQHFAEIYNSADYTVGHYALRYDKPMISSKLIKYGLPPLRPIPLIDTWWVARRELKMHSNRLQAIAEYLDTKTSKTPITFDDWLQAAAGDKKAIKSVVSHCKADVLVLEEVFIKLRPLMKEEPARGLLVNSKVGTCISCGSTHLQRRGWRVALSRRYRQLHCQDCGKWQAENKADTLAKGEMKA